MPTPLQDFVSEFIELNPTMQSLITDELYQKYVKQEKKMIVGTWDDAIKDYRQSITTDMMNMSGEDYYSSLYD